MSFFDKVKGALTSGREELTRQVGRYKNKKFIYLGVYETAEEAHLAYKKAKNEY